MIAVLAASVLALVTQDKTSLRGEPRDAAPRVATLWQGEVVEARREQLGFVEVWDHRRERGGWIRATQVRRYAVVPESVPGLLAIVELLRDTPGAEALGIAHAALALQAGEVTAVGPVVLGAIGTMADRLARRASAQTSDDVVTAHLEVVASYGIRMRSVARPDGRVRLCADGEPWQRLLALGGTAEARLEAVLALTAPECVDATSEHARRAGEVERAALLEGVDPTVLAPHLAERWRVRRAAVWAVVAFDRARAGDGKGSAEAAERALTALAGVDPARMADADRGAYADAAMAVGASRWAAGGVSAPVVHDLTVVARVGAAPGETCLSLREGARTHLERCTFGQPWLASATVAPRGGALALAVSPLPGWRELWLFRRVEQGWVVDVLAPASGAPELGYIEHAGWSPDGSKLLVAREARDEGKRVRSFEVVAVASLAVEVRGEQPGAVRAFGRWPSAEWKATTVALR